MWGDDELVALPGTVRARTPEETWATVSGLLPRFGITRVADLTGLDGIGLPVWTAIRPASPTLSTSQGKGATDLLARLSAVMEAIELWHVAVRGPAADVAPACPVHALPLKTRLPAAELAGIVWDWAHAVGLVRGGEVLLPVDLVRRPIQRPEWTPDVLRATSTGLACGNTVDEAVLHGLFKVVERDVLHRDAAVGGQRRTMVDPASVDDPHARVVLDRLAVAGMELEVALVDGPYGLPVCVAYPWSEDYPTVFGGAGCHIGPVISLTRAVTEAAQSALLRSSAHGTICRPILPRPARPASARPRPVAWPRGRTPPAATAPPAAASRRR